MRSAGAGGFQWTIHHREVVESTMDEAARLAREGAPAGTVVWAETQTRGRGRRGAPWHSPAGAGLWWSFVLRPARAGVELPALTGALGEGMADGIAQACGLRPAIKPPNDLLLGGKKVCGILAEASVPGRPGAPADFVIAGVGLNVNGGPETFPEDLRGIATTLEQAAGRPWDREAVFEACAESLHIRLQADGYL